MQICSNFDASVNGGSYCIAYWMVGMDGSLVGPAILPGKMIATPSMPNLILTGY